MTATTSAPSSQHRRIALLAGQAFALGLMMAWILIPASAVFLEVYGSDLLPVTYIGAGVAGIVSSKVLATALRRQPLSWVATRTIAGLSIALLASWLLLAHANADWVSFALLVLIPIVVPVGFMFVVGQAGLLLDVRALKVLYARVVAGFALGFAVGGFAGPVLLGVLGSAADLLAAAALSAGAFLVLVAATRRSFPAELSVVDRVDVDAERATLRALVRNRYVMLLVAFQMLSAVESQWLDFLVFDRAAQRYDDSDALARFVSQFSAIAYGSDILFLLLVAGFLLHRFGLRYGLTANSLGVLALVLSIIVASVLRGPGTTIVFVLIVTARVTDLVLSDGASRTSLSAAYQAVPTRLRQVVQANVEGLAVPVAIGMSGIGLLIVRAAGRLNGSVLPVLTAGVVVAWAVVAFLLYREYRVNLLASLRQRTLDPADLTIDESENRIVIDRLVASENERDVRLGLDILTAVRHPDLPATLERLALDASTNVRTNALERLADIDLLRAATVARSSLDDHSSQVRAECVRVLAALADPGDVAAIAAHVNDAAPDVKVAAVVAADRSSLRLLLADSDPEVVVAALEAIQWPDDTDLLPAIAAHLHHRPTSAAAADALARGGEPVLSFLDDRLGDRELGRHEKVLLARICREIGGPSGAALLRRHADDPDREVGLALLTALAALGPPDPSESEVVRTELEHATHVVRALVVLEDEPSAMLLSAALRDELELVQRRVLAALSVRFGTERMHRIAFQFAQQDQRSHALALEWLDVTLTGPDRAVVAILEPGLTDRERLSALMRRFPLATLDRNPILCELVEDPDGRWPGSWIKACALYAASGMPEVDLDLLADSAARFSATRASPEDAAVVDETLAAFRERRLAPQMRSAGT